MMNYDFDEKIKNFGGVVTLDKLRKFTCIDFSFPMARNASNEIDRRKTWCQENFGNNWIWSWVLHAGVCHFYFIHREDAMLFSLTWER